MLWLLLAMLVILGFFAAMTRRRRYESVEEEPWRASLGDDEPLDWEAARQAEEEWLQENTRDGDEEDEPWRS
jgi:hypothetical protein